MEKTYVREEVVRLLACERDRCLKLVNGKIDELNRQAREKPATKVSNDKAATKLAEALKDLMGKKPSRDSDYWELLLQGCENDWFGAEPKAPRETLDAVVFPSEERTINVVKDEEYGGAHCYIIRESLGFSDGKAVYVDSSQLIQFVRKQDDGTVIPGLQSEQLVLALIDRHQKLNARFPSRQNRKMIRGLEMFLKASRKRVEDRMKRGVMGNLKK